MGLFRLRHGIAACAVAFLFLACRQEKESRPGFASPDCSCPERHEQPKFSRTFLQTGEAGLTVTDGNAGRPMTVRTGNTGFLSGLNASETVTPEKKSISAFDELLKKESLRIGWDWRLLAALVSAESRFDPEAESVMGAYGLMQIIPETAKHFHVYDYFQPDSNVHAGVSYLKYLDRYLATRVLDTEERVKFVLASYNAGLGHILDAMRLAEKNGKNPNVWNNNVEYYLLRKNEPRYYRDTVSKNGYCNGPQICRYVSKVLENYVSYKNFV